MKILKISALACTLSMMSFVALPISLTSQRSAINNMPITWKTEVIDLGEIPQNIPKSMD